MLSIVQLHAWPAPAIEELVAESEREGFRFVRRAEEEWLSGANRFAHEGEAFFGAFDGSRLVAIGGVNRESDHCARLRRFYVRCEGRRRGVGTRLLRHVLAFARLHYTRVALRCDTDAADRFYRSLGFTRDDSSPGTTHVLEIQNSR